METLERKRLLVWLINCWKNVTFQLVTTHCDMHGNEKAESLAKQGSLIQQFRKKPSFNLVKSHLSTAVQRNAKTEWVNASKGKRWNKGSYKCLLEE
jgi:hypothetical protein